MERTEVDIGTGEIRVIQLTPEEIAAIPVAPPLPALTKIYKSDIWRKASDAEAVTIKAGLLQQPVRLQELWASVAYISTTDELYAALRAGFVAAFGEARTNELLEPTE